MNESKQSDKAKINRNLLQENNKINQMTGKTKSYLDQLHDPYSFSITFFDLLQKEIKITSM